MFKPLTASYTRTALVQIYEADDIPMCHSASVGLFYIVCQYNFKFGISFHFLIFFIFTFQEKLATLDSGHDYVLTVTSIQVKFQMGSCLSVRLSVFDIVTIYFVSLSVILRLSSKGLGFLNAKLLYFPCYLAGT